jgi:hypothetical protein
VLRGSEKTQAASFAVRDELASQSLSVKALQAYEIGQVLNDEAV